MGGLRAGWLRGIVALTGLLAVSALSTGALPARAAEPSTTIAVAAGPRTPTEPGGLDLGNDAVVIGGSARAARFTPRKWPVRTIKYHAKVPKNYQWSLKAAIKSWNATGLKMTLRLVSSKAKSNATIRIDRRIGSDGLATVGYTRGINWIKLMPGEIYKSGPGLAYSRIVLAHIIAHEIGHNLGLNHNTSVNCALMQPFLDGGACPLLDKNRPGYYVCKIVDRAALDPMVRKYGGKKQLGAGKNCTFDPLPPALAFTWSGGLEADAPIKVTWTPPLRVPAGTVVDILYNTTCDFPVDRSGYGFPLSLGQRQARLTATTGSWTQPTNTRKDRGCYGAQVVNGSGAGGAVQSAILTSYVAQPAAPTVGVARRTTWDNTTYQVPVTLPAGGDVELAYLAGTTGHCPGSWPAGQRFDAHEAYVGSDGLAQVESNLTNPCFALFSVAASTRASVPTPVQIGAEPAPAPLVTPKVRRAFDQEGRLAVDLAYDSWVQQPPVAIVGPRNACVTAWPSGEDPDNHLAEYGLDDGGYAYPCVSFFARNASGDPGAAQQVQVEPAAAPVMPTVTNLKWNADDWWYTANVTIRSDLHLVVHQAPKGQCVNSWPPDADRSETPVAAGLAQIYPGYDDQWNELHEPCMSFFAFNDDGAASAPVQVQAPAH